MQTGDYVRLAPNTPPLNDSETVYGPTKGVGYIAEYSYGQCYVKWYAGLLCGTYKSWRFERELVKLTDDECKAHDSWIKE